MNTFLVFQYSCGNLINFYNDRINKEAPTEKFIQCWEAINVNDTPQSYYPAMVGDTILLSLEYSKRPITSRAVKLIRKIEI